MVIDDLEDPDRGDLAPVQAAIRFRGWWIVSGLEDEPFILADIHCELPAAIGLQLMHVAWGTPEILQCPRASGC